MERREKVKWRVELQLVWIESKRESFVDAKCLKIINRVIRRLGFINYTSLIKNATMMINDAGIILIEILRIILNLFRTDWKEFGEIRVE